MVTITPSLYGKLANIKKWEACGFLAGKGHHFNFIKQVKNRSHRINEFEISFWDKFKFVINCLINGMDSHCIFHIHKGKENKMKELSWKDKIHAIPGYYYLIILDGKLYFYKVYAEGNFKKFKHVKCNIRGSKR